MTEPTRKSTYLQFISSMVIIGTIGVFRRYIPVSSAILAFSRGILGSLSLAAFVKLRGQRIRHGVKGRKLLLLIINGAIIGVNWIFLFEAYRFTTVAVATLCYYLQPTLLILASPVFFSEKLTGKKMFFAFTAFAGMVLVSGILKAGGTQTDSFRGVIFGLAAAVLYTVAVIGNKKITGVDPFEKTIIQLASAAIVLIPYILLTGGGTPVHMDVRTIILILIVGIIHTGLVYLLYFGSMEHMSAQAVAVLSYIDPVVAILASCVFLKETISVFEIIGAVLIIGSAIMSERAGDRT
ncbi:MAG: EamA family transporter [Firmicutes bacterium]|nr:EamA family transporter [Bacillota bacterium]